MNYTNNQTNTDDINTDHLSRFLFDNHPVRGEWVSLSDTYQAILSDHNYPLPVQNLLGELLVATCLLTATLKFEGNITIQLQGDGPLSLAVINGNNNQDMRGVARVKDEIAENSTLKAMLGNGYIVLTITPKHGERYQGIVGLDADTLVGCIENYFNQSEQLPTRLFIKTGVFNNKPAAAGMLLQVLPARDTPAESFEYLTTLAQTLTAEEMFSLSDENILYRLFHQEDVRFLGEQPVQFKCTCSRQRCEDSLLTLPADEIAEILEQDEQIDMHCDYCGNHYIFDKIDIAQIKKSIDSNKLNS